MYTMLSYSAQAQGAPGLLIQIGAGFRGGTKAKTSKGSPLDQIPMPLNPKPLYSKLQA